MSEQDEERPGQVEPAAGQEELHHESGPLVALSLPHLYEASCPLQDQQENRSPVVKKQNELQAGHILDPVEPLYCLPGAGLPGNEEMLEQYEGFGYWISFLGQDDGPLSWTVQLLEGPDL